MKPGETCGGLFLIFDNFGWMVLIHQWILNTFGLSVLGSLSTFSMAVRASKPPTTLQKKKKKRDFNYTFDKLLIYKLYI